MIIYLCAPIQLHHKKIIKRHYMIHIYTITHSYIHTLTYIHTYTHTVTYINTHTVFFCKKNLLVLKKVFAGTNTREISEMTLFLVIYTEISNISKQCFFICRYAVPACLLTKKALHIHTYIHTYNDTLIHRYTYIIICTLST